MKKILTIIFSFIFLLLLAPRVNAALLISQPIVSPGDSWSVPYVNGHTFEFDMYTTTQWQWFRCKYSPGGNSVTLIFKGTQAEVGISGGLSQILGPINSNENAHYKVICNNTDVSLYRNGYLVGNVTDAAFDVVSSNSTNNPAVGFLGNGETWITNFTISESLNTPVGSNISVKPLDSVTGGSPITLNFDNVSSGGNTTLTTSTKGPPPTSGFKLGTPPTYYDLQTTAVFDQATVCIDYTGTSLDTNNQKESQLKLYHYVNGRWFNDVQTLDTNLNIICIQVTSFSPFAIFIPMDPPTVDIGGPYNVDEGSSVQLTATGSDPENGTLTYLWDLDDNGDYETQGQTVTFSAAQLDGPSTRTVVVQVTSSDGLSATSEATVNVINVNPSLSTITAPVEPQSVNSAINVSVNFTDPGITDTHVAIWNWGDGSTSDGVVNDKSVSGTHTYTSVGVYTIGVTVTDDDGGSAQGVFQFAVIYDPEGGYVTGGGWFNSPSGAYASNSSLVGRANFGFISKYEKGANVPTGQTEFQFKVADFNFHSTSYDWLVVAGHQAKYKGSGTVNGTGEYGFLLSSVDGQINGGGGIDKFRIKIWDKTNNTVIYDNQLGDGEDANATTALGGGSIVIHQ